MDAQVGAGGAPQRPEQKHLAQRRKTPCLLRHAMLHHSNYAKQTRAAHCIVSSPTPPACLEQRAHERQRAQL